jgi:hypothetical protein
MNVYGVSRNQAVRLALSLVNEALTSFVVTEEDLPNDLAGERGQGEDKG